MKKLLETYNLITKLFNLEGRYPTGLERLLLEAVGY